MPEKHLSTQFDSELSAISTRVMELGGLVESQIRQAIYALSQFSVDVANEVSAAEVRVNAMEVWTLTASCQILLRAVSLLPLTCAC